MAPEKQLKFQSILYWFMGARNMENTLLYEESHHFLHVARSITFTDKLVYTWKLIVLNIGFNSPFKKLITGGLVPGQEI